MIRVKLYVHNCETYAAIKSTSNVYKNTLQYSPIINEQTEKQTKKYTTCNTIY